MTGIAGICYTGPRRFSPKVGHGKRLRQRYSAPFGCLKVTMHSFCRSPRLHRRLRRFGLTVSLGLFLGATAQAAHPENSVCIGCHSTDGLSTALPSGETLPLTLDIAEFHGSVHKALRCVDCHSNIQGYPHPKITAYDRRSFQMERYPQCQTCHADQYKQALDSNHARVLASGNRNGAICVDCHGSHAVSSPDQPRQRISTNCGHCHRTIYEQYLSSAHGRSLLEISNQDVPVCTDCHGSHRQEDPTTMVFRLKSPKICAKCHADREMMRRYGLSPDVFDTYVADFHGLTVTLFESGHPGRETVNEAVCTDCHGVHDIQKASGANAAVIKENLLSTCRRCHPDATASFPDSWVGHFPPSRDRFPLVYYVNLFYRILIPVTIGGMLLFVSLDAFGRTVRRFKRRSSKKDGESEVSPEKHGFFSSDLLIPRRFSVPQRIEHAILAVSFTVLGVTGLAQKYAAGSFSKAIIDGLGGIQSTRIIHRWAAAVFCVLGVYHVIVLVYKWMVRRIEMTMIPQPKDFTDAWQAVRYNLFLSDRHPQMPRYNFTEKVEYWALIWGGIIMAVTGFMLWNPLITTGFLPGQVIPAAKAAHGAEAVLAVLAILVWHFYNVHLKFFNKSMFTGRMSLRQMEEEHAGELARLAAGEVRPLPSSRDIRRRTILFIPLAFGIAAGGLGTIYWAASAETTAVETLPTSPHPGVSAPEPVAPTTSVRSAKVSAPVIPHTIEGQRKCNQCHGAKGMKPMPADHEGRPVESCLICHRPSPQTGSSKAAAIGESAGRPRPVPHETGSNLYKDCAACHGLGKVKPFPSNHAGFAADSCTACHIAAPAPSAAAPSAQDKTGGMPKPIPHSIEAALYKDCTQCHGIGKAKPYPENHATFSVESCTACHQPSPAGGK